MTLFLRGQVWKRVWKMTFLGLKRDQDFENWASHPYQDFPEVPTPPPPGQDAIPAVLQARLLQTWQKPGRSHLCVPEYWRQSKVKKKT